MSNIRFYKTENDVKEYNPFHNLKAEQSSACAFSCKVWNILRQGKKYCLVQNRKGCYIFWRRYGSREVGGTVSQQLMQEEVELDTIVWMDRGGEVLSTAL